MKQSKVYLSNNDNVFRRRGYTKNIYMHIHNKYFTAYGSYSTDRPNESLLKIMMVLQITNVRYGLIIVYY